MFQKYITTKLRDGKPVTWYQPKITRWTDATQFSHGCTAEIPAYGERPTAALAKNGRQYTVTCIKQEYWEGSYKVADRASMDLCNTQYHHYLGNGLGPKCTDTFESKKGHQVVKFKLPAGNYAVHEFPFPKDPLTDDDFKRQDDAETVVFTMACAVLFNQGLEAAYKFIWNFSNVCMEQVADGLRCSNDKCAFAHPRHCLNGFFRSVRLAQEQFVTTTRAQIQNAPRQATAEQIAAIRKNNAAVWKKLNGATFSDDRQAQAIMYNK